MQSRKVESPIITEDGTQIAPEENCSDRRKPKVERRCRIQREQKHVRSRDVGMKIPVMNMVNGDSEDVVSMDGDDLFEYEDGDEEDYEAHETEDGNINFLYKFYLTPFNCSPIRGRDNNS